MSIIHKHLKRLEMGGFWKDPDFGYISVAPENFGTMSSLSVKCRIPHLLRGYTIEEVIEAGVELGRCLI